MMLPYPPQPTSQLTVHLGAVYCGSMTSGSAVVHSPGAFSAADVGCIATVMGCGDPIPIGDGHLPPWGDPNPANAANAPTTNQLMLISKIDGYDPDTGDVTLHDPASCTFDGYAASNFNLTVYRRLVTDAVGSTGCLSGSIAVDLALTSSRDTAQFTIFSEDGTVIPRRGVPVLITDSEDTISLYGALFGGIVDQAKASTESKIPGVTTECACISWDAIFDRRLVSTYQSAYTGNALAVITSLVYYHAGAEGFNVIQTGPTGPDISMVQYDYGTTVLGALDDIVTKSYSLDNSYYWKVDAWKRVYFLAQNTQEAPFNCEDGTGDGSYADFSLSIAITWTGEKLANRAYVASSKQLGTETSEGIVGNGSRTISVSNPIGKKPTIVDQRNPDVEQTVGVDGVDPSGSYNWYWSEGSASLRQDDSGEMPNQATIITVTYQSETTAFDYYQYDEGVEAQAAVSGGTGYCDVLINLDAVSQAGDGATLATSVAKDFGKVSISADMTTYRGGQRCAQLLRIKLAKFQVNENFLIDRVQLTTDGNIKLWQIHAVFGALIGDWRTAMIDLVGNSRMLGAGGSSPKGIPGGLSFTVPDSVPKKGWFTVQNVVVANPTDLVNIDWYLIAVDELKTDRYVTTGSSVDAGTDPLSINVTESVSGAGADFVVGDWVLWDDPGAFEWNQITDIVSSGGGGYTLTLKRAYPGAPSGQATFESFLAEHAAGIKLFRGDRQRYLPNAQLGGFSGAQVPDHYDIPAPSVCVGAVVAAPVGLGGYGTWVVFNCATATVPGRRTFVGGEFSFQTEWVSEDSGVNALTNNFSVDLTQSQRVNFCYAPVSSTTDLVINLVVSEDHGETWTTVETLTIGAGSKTSYSGDHLPPDQQTPYSGTWPFRVLRAGDQLNFTVESGSAAGLTIKMDT